LRSLDALFMPSHQEGMGVVASEAFENGVPPVVNEDSGISRFLQERFPEIAKLLVVKDIDFAYKRPELYADAIVEVHENYRTVWEETLKVHDYLRDFAWKDTAEFIIKSHERKSDALLQQGRKGSTEPMQPKETAKEHGEAVAAYIAQVLADPSGKRIDDALSKLATGKNGINISALDKLKGEVDAVRSALATLDKERKDETDLEKLKELEERRKGLEERLKELDRITKAFQEQVAGRLKETLKERYNIDIGDHLTQEQLYQTFRKRLTDTAVDIIKRSDWRNTQETVDATINKEVQRIFEKEPSLLHVPPETAEQLVWQSGLANQVAVNVSRVTLAAIAGSAIAKDQELSKVINQLEDYNRVKTATQEIIWKAWGAEVTPYVQAFAREKILAAIDHDVAQRQQDLVKTIADAAADGKSITTELDAKRYELDRVEAHLQEKPTDSAAKDLRDRLKVEVERLKQAEAVTTESLEKERKELEEKHKEAERKRQEAEKFFKKGEGA
ncbi:hypothetical protein AB0C51_14775, partial [Streptomyces pathocidini]|uniref:hypothetical protein n=1 Tax=Streptomyces pathocidini TaxID=1650571 RepID=UPI0033FD8624